MKAIGVIAKDSAPRPHSTPHLGWTTSISPSDIFGHRVELTWKTLVCALRNRLKLFENRRREAFRPLAFSR